jgi:hypothetical protein
VPLFLRRMSSPIVFSLIAVQLFAQSPRPKAPTSSIGAKNAAGLQSDSPTAGQPSPLAQVNPTLLSSLHWRSIGPYRGGRTRGVAGVPSQPNVFYIGVCNGGVWKTNDYGRTWQPIFDDQPTGSIGPECGLCRQR